MISRDQWHSAGNVNKALRRGREGQKPRKPREELWTGASGGTEKDNLLFLVLAIRREGLELLLLLGLLLSLAGRHDGEGRGLLG